MELESQAAAPVAPEPSPAVGPALGEGLRGVLALLRTAEFVPCEECALFVVDVASPDHLVLEAHSDDSESDAPRVRVPLRSVKGGGLTGHIAALGKAVRLHGAELRMHPNRTNTPAEFLATPAYSLLALPIRDRRGRVVALLKLNNRCDASGKADPTAQFSERDAEVAKAFCATLASVVESFHVVQAHHRILNAIRSNRGREEVLETILTAGRFVLGADRGDVVEWDTERHDLRLAAAIGEPPLPVGHAIAAEGLIYAAWETESPQFCSDVMNREGCQRYAEISLETRSEAALLIKPFTKKLGVINFEFNRKGTFGESEKRLLHDLASYAGLAMHQLTTRRPVDQVARFLAMPDDIDQLLEAAIDDPSISAILYSANDSERLLESIAMANFQGEAGFDPKKIRYGYDESSFASAVRKSPEACFANPTDPGVHRTIARRCGIVGPMIGIPYRVSGSVVGVLVAWKRGAGSDYWQTDKEKSEVRRKLLELDPVWAYTLQALESARRQKAVLQEIYRISAGGPGNLDAQLDRIGDALQADGFDRVRLFRWDPGEGVFRGWRCWGMKSPEEFLRLKIPPGENRYTQYTYDHAKTDPSAVLFDPTGASPGSIGLGPDPHGGPLEKKADTPWAVVPLVFHGKLYGQIAADTRRSGRRITAEFLQYMTVIGGLAAQMLAFDEMIADATNLRVQQLADEVMEVILHSIKTPVHSVVGLVSQLKREQPPEKRQRWIGMLAQQAEWLRTLMRQTDVFVDCMSRYRVAEENLAEIAAQAVALVEPLAEKKRVRVRFECPPRERCELACDRTAILVILQNLLDNAVKHSPTGAKIEVTVTVFDGERDITVAVADEGPGMDEEQAAATLGKVVGLPRLSDPEPRGLGLPIAQALAARAGGEVTYVRRRNGEGGRFIVRLPRRSSR